MERLTVLSIDEMFIKDEICLDRSLEQVFGPHKTAQVMMCQGLFSSWKQPVYYNFDAPVNKDELLDVVKQLFECKYIVVAIVNDMGPSNMALWKAKGIDKDHVSFVDPSDSEKLIFLFADLPHLLKLIRNHFLGKGFKLFDEMITKNCVESLLKISQSSELKIAHKINSYHLDVKGSQRQKVKPAAQLLSNTVSKAVEWCGDNKLIPDKNYKNTASFIKLVNDWFDYLTQI
ncbi:hypothetical protein Zmor_000872 [Zophobas morio]|uniref:Transposable element P transposase n=1 Tax=Zophobas morio TaxID=2755281 RepID=A0AA38MNV1_9CUCU|nr:hypothetical protein Zmor_000872 [Zophobas morio]